MPEQVFQSIATKEGSVEKVPVNSNDITNKNYVDNLITTLTVGTLLATAIIIGSLIKLNEQDGILFINASTLINESLNVTKGFQANNTFFVTEHNKVGIGNNTPDSSLHIFEGSSGQDPIDGTKLTLEDDAVTYISFLTPNSVSPGIIMADPESGAAGFFLYTHDADSWVFGMNGLTRVFIDSDSMDFQQAETITTITGDLTLNPEGNLLISSGVNVGIGTTAPTQTLVAIGDGNITGNLTANLFHGEMFVDEDITTAIDVSGEFFNVTINKTGDLNGFRHNQSNGTLVALFHGDYFVTHSASFTGGANDVYDITLAINLETQIDCEIDSKLQAGGNEVGVSASCILELDPDDELRMMVANQGATNDPTFTHANIVLFRIGI